MNLPHADARAFYGRCRPFFLCALFLSFFITQAFGAGIARSAAHMPGADMAISQQKQNAITLLQNGQHAEAYDAFMRLLREEPNDDDVNMGIAISAYKTKQYAQALMAYERLLIKYPRDARLRVELARVYVALGEPESARLELYKAKEYDPNLTDEHVASILAALSSKVSRWQHSGRISFGVMHDSNSNQGPNSNVMTLGGFKDLFVEGVKQKESWGNYLSGSFELGYRLGEESPFWIMGDILGYQRWNTSSGVKSNKGFSYGRSAMGLRYLSGKMLVDMRLKGDVANQHHKDVSDQNITNIGPELTFVVGVHPRLQFITRGTWDKRDYSITNQRDGDYWSAAQYARVFIGEKNHELMIGVAVTGNQPEVTAYKYFATEPTARLVIKLPFDFSFAPFVSYREEKYDGPATGLETSNRRDKTWRTGAGLIWDVTNYLSLDCNYQHVDNDSNSSLYKYRQNIVSMGVTLKF